MESMLNEAVSIKTAFHYPFNRAKGLLNILLVFVPIFGWFALGGYGVRITKEFTQGKFTELPTFSFGSDMSLGFWLFLKGLPLMIASFGFIILVSWVNPLIGSVVNFLLSFFVLPVLVLNLMVHETIESSFDFNIVKAVFQHFGDYLAAFLKSIFLAVVFAFLSLILIGIPANAFTKNLFLADFYRRHIGKGANPMPPMHETPTEVTPTTPEPPAMA